MQRKRTASDLIQQAINSSYAMGYRFLESPPPNMDGMARRVFLIGDHLRTAASKLGLECKCSDVRAQHSRPPKCICTRKTSKKKKRR